MSSRQDKLILLIDTGTSTQVRRTASKQLVDLVHKTFTFAVTPVKTESDVPQSVVTEDEAWAEVLETISKLLPLISSKSSESRSAAAFTLGLLAERLPAYRGTQQPSSELDIGPVKLPDVLRDSAPLLASAGREYAGRGKGDKGNRKAFLGSLGLDENMMGDNANDLLDEGEAVQDAPPPPDIFEGLSARQITMLKRKKGNMMEEANKLRKLNGMSASASATPTPRGSPVKSSTPLPGPSNKIEPASVSTAKVIAIEPGHSPWTSVFFEIVPQLADATWQARHGSASAIMEIMRSISTPHILAIARHLVTLLALDRFGDFLGDTVMAPVREVSAQALGVCLKYLPESDVAEVHRVLLEMIHQPWAVRGRKDGEKWEKFSWELRHAGLLGLKYEVVVRGDLLSMKDVKVEVDYMQDVLDACIKAMCEVDDDVRTVAATCLLPIVDVICCLPTQHVSRLLDTVWTCLADDGDDLGSSVGAIMDLLGVLIANPVAQRVIEETNNRAKLIPRTYAYIRHPITSVRRAVVDVLYRFVTSASDTGGAPNADWMFSEFFSLMFENLILETVPDIRETSYKAFTTALQEVEVSGEVPTVTEGSLEDWFDLVMTPIGKPLPQAFGNVPKKRAGHDIDKPMMQGDLGLVDAEVMWATRIDAARALASLRQYRLEDVAYIRSALQAGSAHSVIMACIILQEWAYSAPGRLGTDEEAVPFVPILTSFIESPAPAIYTELSATLDRLQTESQSLLSSFSEAKVPKTSIPKIARPFSIAAAQKALTTDFDALVKLVPKAGIKAVAGIQDKKAQIYASIGYYTVTKERLDAQVGAAVASALLAMQTVPEKHGPLVRAIMNAIKVEESEILQARAARAVADFISFVQSPYWNKPINAPDKVVQNLFTYVHSDPAVCPVFTPAQGGILSLTEATDRKKEDETPDQRKKRITRRGALLAFKAMATAFGADLWTKVPQIWAGLSTALLSQEQGQKVIDALVSVRLITPHLSTELLPKMHDLFPALVSTIQNDVAVVRHQAAQSLATLCNLMPETAMRTVIDHVVPLVGDAKRVHARQGSLEAIHHIIKLLDLQILPYVLFLIVPVLGRMSDPDEPVRLLSTSTFASLIKMVPLEAGLPDPPGFSAELLDKRDEERQFLMQLLDGTKAEQYKIPIEIKADLRQYQKDGVSWLAFLAKYQLHGILCDDMGLGKSLQSICIVGSKHHERAARHRQTGSVDSAHLPSLIVCPPTLTGHWYYEISKFTSDLSAIQYVGNAGQRAYLRPQLQKHDVVITSYETVRADIDILGQIDWLYCVLDEGHIIKNAKTKLSAAVKQIRAQHRLLLSGTPIQNNLLELWSLFDFLMPGFLGTERQFQEKFGKPVMADREGKASAKEREAAATALEALHKQVLPFLLRRLKEDVLQDLPPKIIQDYYCDLSPLQAVLYDEFQKSRAAEEAGQEVQQGAGQGHVFQSLQYLRKLCNHPALVMDGEPKQIESIKRRAGLPDNVGLKDVSNAPKLEALKQLLNDCGIGLDKAEQTSDHRVLIFCQLRPMLDLIETTLFAKHMPTVSYMRLDGAVDPKKRHSIVQTFNADPRIDVLLLTTSVGGLGLNLTSADTVIFVDHDWNPMKDLQAMDRAHRLGQRKVVNVYRLIMKGTLEEKIMGLQRFKLNIASSVVTQQNAGLGSMNTGEVLDLFKVSADGEPGKPKKEPTGPVSASKVLEGLDDLPPEDEYADLSLSNFLSKV